MIDPEKLIPAWEEQSACARAQQCALFLLIHDFITDGERQKIHQRMMKWVAKHRAAQATDTTTPGAGGGT